MPNTRGGVPHNILFQRTDEISAKFVEKIDSVKAAFARTCESSLLSVAGSMGYMGAHLARIQMVGFVFFSQTLKWKNQIRLALTIWQVLGFCPCNRTIYSYPISNQGSYNPIAWDQIWNKEIGLLIFIRAWFFLLACDPFESFGNGTLLTAYKSSTTIWFRWFANPAN